MSQDLGDAKNATGDLDLEERLQENLIEADMAQRAEAALERDQIANAKPDEKPAANQNVPAAAPAVRTRFAGASARNDGAMTLAVAAAGVAASILTGTPAPMVSAIGMMTELSSNNNYSYGGSSFARGRKSQSQAQSAESKFFAASSTYSVKPTPSVQVVSTIGGLGAFLSQPPQPRALAPASASLSKRYGFDGVFARAQISSQFQRGLEGLSTPRDGEALRQLRATRYLALSRALKIQSYLDEGLAAHVSAGAKTPSKEVQLMLAKGVDAAEELVAEHKLLKPEAPKAPEAPVPPAPKAMNA